MPALPASLLKARYKVQNFLHLSSVQEASNFSIDKHRERREKERERERERQKGRECERELRAES